MNNKLKKFNKKLQKHIDNRDFIRLYRNICGKPENISGFILDRSDNFLLIQTDFDFSLDGYVIIPIWDFDTIAFGKNEKKQKQIFEAEGVMQKSYGFPHVIPLSNWNQILQTIQSLDYHIVCRSISKDYYNFHIGPITEVKEKNFHLHNYDVAGKFDKKAIKVKFKNLRAIIFGDNYSTVFRKYTDPVTP